MFKFPANCQYTRPALFCQQDAFRALMGVSVDVAVDRPLFRPGSFESLNQPAGNAFKISRSFTFCNCSAILTRLCTHYKQRHQTRIFSRGDVYPPVTIRATGCRQRNLHYLPALGDHSDRPSWSVMFRCKPDMNSGPTGNTSDRKSLS
jgi:hypothetical protein